MAMRQAARDAASTNADVGAAVRAAMNTSGVYGAYNNLCLVGSADIVGHARAAIDALVATRDLLMEGESITGDTYLVAREALRHELAILRNRMRNELGQDELPLDVLIRPGG